MALDALLAHIDRRARAASDALRAAARKQADSILEEANHEARTRVEQALSKRRAELEREARASLAVLDRELRARVLTARQALIDRVLEESVARVPSTARSAVYGRAVGKRTVSALAYLDGDAVIACAPNLVGAVEDELARARAGQGPRVRIEADPTVSGGAIARSADARVLIDETLAARLSRQRARLSIAILERLSELACLSGGAR